MEPALALQVVANYDIIAVYNENRLVRGFDKFPEQLCFPYSARAVNDHYLPRLHRLFEMIELPFLARMLSGTTNQAYGQPEAMMFTLRMPPASLIFN